MSSQEKSKPMDVTRVMENPDSVVTIPKPILRPKSPARELQERIQLEIIRLQGELLIDLVNTKGRQAREETRIKAEKEIAATKVSSIVEITEIGVDADRCMLICETTASRDTQDLVANGRNFIKIVTAQAHQTISGVLVADEQAPNVVDADFEINEQNQA